MANLLCPGNIAVSGHQASCEAVPDVAAAAGAMKCIPLAVAGAFHTPLMESALGQLKTALQEVEISEPQMPVYANVNASPHQTPENIRDLLIQQVCSPVRWHETMGQMLESGFDQFYEVGEGRVLRGLMKRINRKTSCVGVLG